MDKVHSVDFGGRALTVETKKVARQADGSCMVRYGDTVVLVTACRAPEASVGLDFMPLTVNYQEMTYAAGKIPGGFFKREGRPSEKEVLCSRLIDRPLRPLFPKSYHHETQVIATVMSIDPENDPEVAALVGASTALTISDIPFGGPVAVVRVGRVEGELVCNPSHAQRKESDIDLLVAGTKDAIIMVEGGAQFAPEDDMLAAMDFAHSSMQGVIEFQSELAREVGNEKITLAEESVNEALVSDVAEFASDKIKEAMKIPEKLERYDRLRAVSRELLDALRERYEDGEKEIKKAFSDLKYTILRESVLDTGTRVDGRGLSDVRQINSEVGLLPRTHGSALFTRGETQAMVIATLGTSDDAQRIDALLGWESKRFMLHYNFPPFSVGEVKFLRSPGRREIGHGALAERAVVKVLPSEEDFPYTVRIVSEILESNGSSSMASICGASLALMDAGVPIKGPVAGIAMGLIMEGDRVAVLSDILGDEDHLGDMDFKVAGNEDGITAFQMDTKIGGVPSGVLKDAMYQARDGRLHILGKMNEAINKPREEISTYAPRIVSIYVRQEKIKDVIGPGGKNIRGIVEKTGVKIDVDDSGKVSIASADEDAAKAAIELVRGLTQEAEVGKIYVGKVKKVLDFGAFVEILPNTDGLVHISQLAHERVKEVRDVVKEGDEVMVKVIEIDRSGKIRLSRKEALSEEEG